MSKLNELKSKGNLALQKENFDEAINFYNESIKLDPCNHTLFCNRSAAYAKSGKFNLSLGDALKTIGLKMISLKFMQEKQLF